MNQDSTITSLSSESKHKFTRIFLPLKTKRLLFIGGRIYFISFIVNKYMYLHRLSHLSNFNIKNYEIVNHLIQRTTKMR